MKNNKKIISLLLGILMLSSSVYANSNTDNMEMETEIIENLQPISSSYPFDFEVVSSSEDTAVIAFLADELNDSSFYLGVKGEKEEAECIGSGQYAVQIETEYAFVFNYTVNNERITYNGTLIAEDYDENGIIAKYTDVAVNKTYAGELTPSAKVSLMSSYSTLSSGEKDESEPNDTYSTADRTYDDYDNYGTLDIEDDVDWWKVEFDEDGEANFWLGNIPEDCDFDLYVYDEYGVDDGDYLARSRNGGNEQELITLEVEADVIYYAEIYSYDGSSDDYYSFRTKNYPFEEDSSYAEDDFEPNDSFSDPTTISRNDYLYANIHDSDDEDFYEFYLNDIYEVTIELWDIPSGCDYDLELYDDNLDSIDVSASGGNNSEDITVILESGWYYIHVYPYGGTYSEDEYYLEINADENSASNSKAIVVIPGIIGSELENDSGELVWVDLGVFNDDLDDLECDESGESIEEIFPITQNTYGARNTYELLFTTLQDEFSDEYDVLFFAYDWRLSCNIAANKLYEMIYPYQEVIFVAHSMGGLVASQYMAFATSTRNQVDKLITLGTPFTGTPKAPYIMETGRIVDWMFIQDIVGLLLDGRQHNFPAIYELFPTNEYFDFYNHYIVDDGIILSTFDDSQDYMESRAWGRYIYNNQVKPMFEDAIDFHNSMIINGEHIANLSSVDSYYIYGTYVETISAINYTDDGDIDYVDTTYSGDGTVPLGSAINNSNMIEYGFTEIDHIALVKNSDVISLVSDIINEVDTSSTVQSATLNMPSSNLDGNTIAVVTEDIADISIVVDDIYSVYDIDDTLYYEDNAGNVIKIGNIWYLGGNRYQYSLLDNNYKFNIQYVTESNPELKILSTQNNITSVIASYEIDTFKDLTYTINVEKDLYDEIHYSTISDLYDVVEIVE